MARALRLGTLSDMRNAHGADLEGLFSTIGAIAGGAAGTFGGPLGTAVGSAAGGFLGGAADKAMGGGGKKKKKKKKKKAKLAASMPAPAAAAAIAAPKLAAARTVVARKVSSIVGKAGLPYEALAQAAGVDPRKARAARIPGSTLIKEIGLPAVARLVGAPSTGALAKQLKLSPKLVKAVGLAQGAKARKKKYGPRTVRGAMQVIIHCGRRRRRPFRGEVVLGELDELEGLGAVKRKRPLARTKRLDETGPIPGVNADLPDGPPDVDVDIDVPHAPAPKGGNPGPVTVRKENWDFETSRYKLAWGDTLVGLAQTYLPKQNKLDGVRLIWAAQDDNFRMTRKMDKLFAGEFIRMPEEAVKEAKRQTSSVPSWVLPAAIGLGVVGTGAVIYGYASS